MWQNKDDSLYRRFDFYGFSKAIPFVTEVGNIAEEASHHPTIKISFDAVEIWLQTHRTKSITEKDKTMAKKIDKLFEDTQSSKVATGKASMYTDGGSRGNPGPSAIGIVIFDKDKNVIKKVSEYIGETTNNQAEYRALKAGLNKAKQLGITELIVYMDSELIIHQINGKYKVKNAELKPIYQAVKDLVNFFEQVSFKHVLREHNSIADGLVNKALDER